MLNPRVPFLIPPSNTFQQTPRPPVTAKGPLPYTSFMTALESGWLKLKMIDPLVGTSHLCGPMHAAPGTVHFPVRHGPMSTSGSDHADNIDLM